MCVFVISSHLLTFNYIFFVAILFCRFLFSCISCVCSSGSLMSNSLWPHGLYHTRLLCPRGFSRQKYWSGLPFPAPGDLSNPGTEPASLCVLHWEMCSLPLASPGKPLYMLTPPLHLWNSSAELSERLFPRLSPSVRFQIKHTFHSYVLCFSSLGTIRTAS